MYSRTKNQFVGGDVMLVNYFDTLIPKGLGSRNVCLLLLREGLLSAKSRFSALHRKRIDSGGALTEK